MPSANQEQEQEQEQDLTPQGPPGGRSPPAKKAHKPTARGKREARAREVFERTERFRVRVLLKGRGGRKCTPTTTKRLLALVAHVRGSRGCDEPAAWHVVEAYAEGALREAAAALERGRDNATKLVTWRGDGWEWRPSRFDAWASRNETLVDEVIRGIARGPDPLAELAEPEPPADAASLDALRAAQSGAAAARSVS